MASHSHLGSADQPIDQAACGTVSRSEAVESARRPRPGFARPCHPIDQAIFTSATSMTGRGYRVVAASHGVTAEERRIISAASPSHNALCDESADATGVAFYRLGMGRYCVARTCTAGQEQSARGGKRLLTQAFLLTPEQLAIHDDNPFDILRSAQQAGALISDPAISGTIDPASMTSPQPAQARAICNAFCAVGESGMAFLLDETLSDGCFILAGVIENAPTVIEGVLMSMPSALRRACSFSYGIKFALARRHRLNIIGPDAGDARRITHGQQIDLIEAMPTEASPQDSRSAWAAMVADCWHSSKLVELIALNRLDFDDASAPTLDHVARRRVEMNHVGQASIETLLGAIADTEVVEGPPAIIRTIESQYRSTICSELLQRCSTAPSDAVRPHWPTLCNLARHDAGVARICDALRERFDEFEPDDAAVTQESLEYVGHAHSIDDSY